MAEDKSLWSKQKSHSVVFLRWWKTNGMSASIRSAWLMTLGQNKELYRKHHPCAFTAAFKIYFPSVYKEHAVFYNLNWKLLEGKMIVCHRQGGASDGGRRKEAATGWCVGTHHREMITSVRRKQRRGEGETNMRSLNLSSIYADPLFWGIIYVHSFKDWN